MPLCGWLSSTIVRGLSEEQQGNRRPRRPQEVLSGCVRKQRGGWKVLYLIQDSVRGGHWEQSQEVPPTGMWLDCFTSHSPLTT